MPFAFLFSISFFFFYSTVSGKWFPRDKLIQIFTRAVNNDNFFFFFTPCRSSGRLFFSAISCSTEHCKFEDIHLSLSTSQRARGSFIHGAKRLFSFCSSSRCCIKMTPFRYTIGLFVRFRGLRYRIRIIAKT